MKLGACFRAAVGLLVWFCIVLPAYGDRVRFANGDVITGTVTSMTGGRLAIKTAYAQRIVVDAAHVEVLEIDEPVNVHDKNGDQQYGKVALREDTLTVDGSVSQPWNEVTRLSRQRTVGFDLTNWSHRLDIITSATHGNVDTQSLSAITESVFRREHDEQQLNILLGKDENAGLVIRDIFELNYGYKRFLENPKWFVSGNGNYFRDALIGVEPRVSVGGGAGYRFWDNSLGSLTVELGLSGVYEADTEYEGVYPAARWALDYRRRLVGEQLEVFHRQQLFVSGRSGRGQILDASVGVRLLISERWDANARINLRHDTQPPANTHGSDVTYAVGVGIRF